LGRTISEIFDAKRVYSFGVRTSYSVAHYLSHGLNRLLGKCEQLEPGTGDLPEKLSMITSSDLIIAINLPRYTRQTIDVAEIAKKRNAKVIGITDGYSSPLAEFSDVILPCSFSSISFHNSVLGAIFIADYLISAVAAKQPELTENRLKEVEAILNEWDTHVIKKGGEGSFKSQ
jgi:DNA-binding MurR/RpiR family transcriptional regulator